MRPDLQNLLKARRGHFELESGHHGELWLDLESLCRKPDVVRQLASELAHRLSQYRPEVVCGPLVEGAFVGLLVAQEMNVEFVYTRISILTLVRRQYTPALPRRPRLFVLNPAHHLRR